MSYADRTLRPPRTLTAVDAKRILRVTGAAAAGFRDHVVISLALGAGLRESEIVGLSIGDVRSKSGKAVRVLQLPTFKGATRPNADPRDQRVPLPDATWYKLDKYLRRRVREGERSDVAPLFLSRKGNRLSTRQVREMFQTWQERAGIDRPLYRFHELRHTAITHVRRATKDIRIAQRFARHASIQTTIRYEHASDQEVLEAVKGILG